MLGRIGEGGGHRVTGDRQHRARHIGWDRVHVAIDDHSRLADAEELPDEAPVTTAAFLWRAWRFYAAHGITIERILTDNGGCNRSRDFAAACDELGIGHRFTRPYRPQTNGKAERMVRTLLGEWAAELVGIRPSTVKRHLADLRARSGLTTEQLTYAGRASGRLVVPSLEPG